MKNKPNLNPPNSAAVSNNLSMNQNLGGMPMEGVQSNQGSKSGAGNSHMNVTMGQNKAPGDTHMSDADKKGGASKQDAPASGAADRKLKVKDPNQAHEVLEIQNNVPQARFGHTITMVNKYKVVLFGGATGDTGKYSMTGETFIFNLLLRTWTELTGKFLFDFTHFLQVVKGVPPSPRAAHASTNVEQM
jgi:hypothetical protein